MDMLDVFFQCLIEWIYEPIKNRFGSAVAVISILLLSSIVIFGFIALTLHIAGI